MNQCDKCACSDSCERVWKGMENATCVGYTPVVTNGDRIRQMSDIELAKWVCKVHGACPTFCPMSNDCDGENCDGQWIDWLREVAKE